MSKSKFDYMGFKCGGGPDVSFVVHAKKYTKEQVVEMCQKEYGRTMTAGLDDVREAHVAYRMGVDPHEWPDGAYTFVAEGSPGAFPVWVIDLENLGAVAK